MDRNNNHERVVLLLSRREKISFSLFTYLIEHAIDPYVRTLGVGYYLICLFGIGSQII